MCCWFTAAHASKFCACMPALHQQHIWVGNTSLTCMTFSVAIPDWLISGVEYVKTCGIWLTVYWGSCTLVMSNAFATWLLCCTGIYGSSSRGLNWASFRHVCCRNSYSRVWLVRCWHYTTGCSSVPYMCLSIAASESLNGKSVQCPFCHAHDDRAYFEKPSALLLGEVVHNTILQLIRHCKTPNLGKVYVSLDIE